MSKTIEVRYVSHLVVITGKMKERIETKARDLGQLIVELDEEYSCFADIFLGEDNSSGELKAAVYLRRKDTPPQGVIYSDFKLEDEDIYMFW